MTAAALLDGLTARGARLEARGDRVGIQAPKGVVTAADLEALRVHKLALLALLSSGTESAPLPAPGALDLAQRWGPGLADGSPAIDLDADAWRWAVAGWPHEQWATWRRLAGELLPSDPTAEQIRTADQLAYVKLIGSNS